jgi:hypothetical protein
MNLVNFKRHVPNTYTHRPSCSLPMYPAAASEVILRVRRGEVPNGKVSKMSLTPNDPSYIGLSRILLIAI